MGRDIKTKFNAFVLIGILMLANGIASVWLADIYLSDTQNTYSTKITCSNGNVYNATEANLQAAITAIGNDGWIECPEGKISLTGDIALSGNTNLILRGYGTELEVANSAAFAGSALFTLYNCAFITIEGFELDGNHPYNTTSAEAYAGIDIRKTSNSTFKDLEIHHVLGDGIVIEDATELTLNDENSSNNLVTRNFIHHIGEVFDTVSAGDAGVRVMGASHMCNNVFSYNTIDMIREHGIKIYGYASIGASKYWLHDNNKIIGNMISNCNQGNWDLSDNVYGTGIYAGGAGTKVDGNTIYMNKLMEHGIQAQDASVVINNNIEFMENMHSSFAGIYMQSTAATVSSGGVSISHNIIEGHDYTNTRGITLEGSVGCAQNSSVAYNIIRNVSSIAITGWVLKHCDISRNIIFDCGSDAINVENAGYCSINYNHVQDAGDEGLSITSCKNSSFDNNIIERCAGEGVVVSGACSHISISHNTINNIYLRGIYFLTSSYFNYTDVSFNDIFSNGDSAGIYLDNMENSTIIGNIIRGVFATGIVEVSDCRYNMFIGNNAKDSTSGYNIDSVTYKPYPSVNFTMLNFGTWT
jgi:parallel beta-helix repeat protein